MQDIFDLEAFIARPDVIDLIFQDNQATRKYFEQRPYIHLGKATEDYVIAYIEREDLHRILDELDESLVNVAPMVMGLLGSRDLEEAGITEVQSQPYLDLNGQGVLVGFIDTGIDYSNPAFLHADGTSKIRYIWDQSLDGNAPEGYYFGAEYAREQINQALQSEEPFSAVPSKDTVGHGTFLASVAASAEMGEYIGAAPSAELIVVKLKKARSYYTEYYLVPPEQENVYESSDLMLGIQYVIDKALILGMPVAICIGVGTNLGSHDGLGTLDTYISRICNEANIAMCLAPGNESNMRHHASGTMEEAGETYDVELRVGEEGGSVYLNIWTASSDKMSISITSPTGETIGRFPFKARSIYESNLVLEKARISIEYVFPVVGSGSELAIIKLMDPTPGIWKISVYGDIIVNGTFHAWLPLTGLVNDAIEFLIPDPNYTIVVPATALGTITSGAYSTRDGSLYINSSWGPTRLPASSPVMVSPGVNVTGIYPNYYGSMTGTSVSTAITAGACALMLQWGVVKKNKPVMTSFLIRSYFIKGCLREPRIKYPSDQWGYGKLNLYNTFVQMRN